MTDDSLSNTVINKLKESVNLRLGPEIGSGMASIRDKIISSQRFQISEDDGEIRIDFALEENLGIVCGFIGGKQSFGQSLAEMKRQIADATGNNDIHIYAGGHEIPDRIKEQYQLRLSSEFTKSANPKQLPDMARLNDEFQIRGRAYGENYSNLLIHIKRQETLENDKLGVVIIVSRKDGPGRIEERLNAGEELLSEKIVDTLKILLKEFGADEIRIEEEYIPTETEFYTQYLLNSMIVGSLEGHSAIVQKNKYISEEGMLPEEADRIVRELMELKQGSEAEIHFDGTYPMEFGGSGK